MWAVAFCAHIDCARCNLQQGETLRESVNKAWPDFRLSATVYVQTCIATVYKKKLTVVPIKMAKVTLEATARNTVPRKRGFKGNYSTLLVGTTEGKFLGSTKIKCVSCSYMMTPN